MVQDDGSPRSRRGRPGPAGHVVSRIRPFRAEDLDSIAALDRAATGEDRGTVIAELAAPDGTRVLERDGGIGGFVIRAPWGGGATVAPRVEDALAILHARRVAAGPGKRVRCGILAENSAGADALAADGWTEAWRAPRLIRGEPLDWQPDHIWGQFNHAHGLAPDLSADPRVPVGSSDGGMVVVFICRDPKRR